MMLQLHILNFKRLCLSVNPCHNNVNSFGSNSLCGTLFWAPYLYCVLHCCWYWVVHSFSYTVLHCCLFTGLHWLRYRVEHFFCWIVSHSWVSVSTYSVSQMVCCSVLQVSTNQRPALWSRDLHWPIRAKSQPEPELVLGAECTFGNVLICPCHLGKLLLWVWWLNFSKLVQPKVGISLR